MSHISNERMDAFISTISKQVKTVLQERGDDILKAWHESIQESVDNEDKFPPLKLSLSATIDLEKNQAETQLTFTTRYKSSIAESLPDPNQPEFPAMSGLTMTVVEP